MLLQKEIKQNRAPLKALAVALGALLLVGLMGGFMPTAASYYGGAESHSAPTVRVAEDPELGMFLTDREGMTLYLFTQDETGVSNCYGQCAVNWPPLLLEEGEPVAPDGLDGSLGLITRRDGSRQVTYNGIPLYYWIRDEEVGDTTGHGVGDVWYVVNP